MKQRPPAGIAYGALASLSLLGCFTLQADPARGLRAPSSVPSALVIDSIDQALGEVAVDLRKGVLQLGRNTLVTVSRAVSAWARYARRGAKFALLALLFGLADRHLLAAWRASGLRVLTNYVPLMAYVYTRLLFDRRVYAVGKLLLFGALAYGVVRRDLVPDRTLFPGLVDDVILVAVSVRLLLSWCSDDIVYAHATTAVKRWRRLAAVQGARQRLGE